jgi:HAD superfamily hydrolase (TIGR01509 family)
MQKNNRLFIFDLDGVLLDSRELHYESLNLALETIDNKFIIGWDEHLSFYDGLPTTKKLQMLNAKKDLPKCFFDQIWKTKQQATVNLLKKLTMDYDLAGMFEKLKSQGVLIAVASNSIRETIKIALLKLGLLEHVDYFVSNQDVSSYKPFPEMYWKCMIKLGALPRTTVIFEDSHIGRQGAIDSGAFLMPIENRQDLTQGKIDRALKMISEKNTPTLPWNHKSLNILVPMAGLGNRFAVAGYTFPKPLIEVNGKPMIQVVVDNLNINAHYIFVVQKAHYDKYHLQYLLNLIAPGCDIIQVDGITEGAACTTLLAKDIIDNNNPLLIVNSDQYIEWNSNECMYAFIANGVDGGIVTFEATHPKWSYVKLDNNGFVQEVAEKKVISNQATAGVYFWRKGSDYVQYASQMIDQNIRVNNEFYVAPVYNQAILEGKKIRVKNIDRMWGLGTPEDLNSFLEHNK